MLKNPGALRSGIFVRKPSAQLTEAPRKSSRFRYRAKRAAESGLTAPYEFSCCGGGGSEQAQRVLRNFPAAGPYGDESSRTFRLEL